MFKIFPWNNNFDTNIEIIDEQHKVLVEILNKLASHLANRATDVVLNDIFEQLIDYTNYHFQTEEAIWSKHLSGDDWFKSHQATHHSFVSELLEIKNNKSNQSMDDVIYGIISFLSKWLAYHILDTDKRMAIIVQRIEQGASIEQAKIDANKQMSGSTKVLINTVLKMYESISTTTLDLMREQALRKMAEEALSKSEERWKFILEGGVEDVWDWDIEQNKLSRSENEPTLFDILGKRSAHDETLSIHPADIERMKSDFEAHIEGLTEFYVSKHRVLTPTGGWSWVLSRGKVVSRDDNGNARRMVGTHTDITEREIATQIFKNSKQAIFMTDTNNNIICTNPAFTKITGYLAEEAIGKNPKFLASGEHSADFYHKMWASLNKNGSWSGEIYNRRKNGESYPEYLRINAVKDFDDDLDHYFAIFDDITEQKKAQELLLEHANYDALTKLFNRRMFQERLQQEVKRSDRTNIQFALLYIGLDHFKDINETLGHEIGDLLLVEVAKRIKSQTRESDTLSRIGGDEFTLIISDLNNSNEIIELADKLLSLISQPFQIQANQIHSSVSIGISIYPNDAANCTELLKNAGQAMYLAKESGRNNFSYYTSSMQEEAQQRYLILSELRKAIELNQFQLYYQPIVNLKTGEITKAEALIRWNHPEHGLIPPDSFIPIAEQSGLIETIGDWVFKEATNQAKEWQSKYNIKISINKSPMQFNKSLDINTWLNHLIAIDLPNQYAIIEITENFLMEHEQKLVDKLLHLRNKGIQLSLDDFGTGYSSLSYLQKFEIDFLKIDRSFISNLVEGSNNIVLCEAIITMAQKLQIKVVAEGIETEFQKNLLSAMNCDFGQGYYFSRPIPAQEFQLLLDKHANEQASIAEC